MLTMVASRIVMMVPRSTTPNAIHLYSMCPRRRAPGPAGFTSTATSASELIPPLH